jgi:hypothetical protein
MLVQRLPRCVEPAPDKGRLFAGGRARLRCFALLRADRRVEQRNE